MEDDGALNYGRGRRRVQFDTDGRPQDEDDGQTSNSGSEDDEASDVDPLALIRAVEQLAAGLDHVGNGLASLHAKIDALGRFVGVVKNGTYQANTQMP